MKSYQPRIVDAEIDATLEFAGGVFLRGPRACGKTSTARQHSASEVSLERDTALRNMAQMDAGLILGGDTPRLVDEWQLVPDVWNAVRNEIDDRGEPGQFLLTGSATPEEESRRHSGAGRIVNVTLRTMTLQERFGLTPSVRLADLLSGNTEVSGDSDATVAAFAEWITEGGWPGWSHRGQSARRMTESYLDQIAEHDFPVLAGRRRDPQLMMAFLRAYASAVAQPMSMANIRRRMGELLVAEPDQATVPRLHDFAERLFLVEDQPAWSRNLRSKTRLLQSPKRHLADPSLVCALLGAGPQQLLGDLPTFGHVFESLVVHDVRVIAQNVNARGVFHLRDTAGRDEIDIVVEAADGAWVGMEVKLSLAAVEAAAANLVRVAEKVEQPPAALAVIVPSGPAYRLPNGVAVVPLACLG